MRVSSDAAAQMDNASPVNRPRHVGWVGLPTQRYLHQVLRSGQIESLYKSLAKMRHARQQGFLSVEEYMHLLTGRNRWGTTPLHHALSAGEIYKLWVYLDAVSQARDDGWLSFNEYTDLLISPNYVGLTPLYMAANSNSLQVCQYFITLLEQLCEQNPSISLKKLLCKNVNWYMPYCSNDKKNSLEINKFLAQKRQASATQYNHSNGITYYLSTYYWQGHNSNTFFASNSIHTEIGGATYYFYPCYEEQLISGQRQSDTLNNMRCGLM